MKRRLMGMQQLQNKVIFLWNNRALKRMKNNYYQKNNNNSRFFKVQEQSIMISYLMRNMILLKMLRIINYVLNQAEVIYQGMSEALVCLVVIKSYFGISQDYKEVYFFKSQLLLFTLTTCSLKEKVIILRVIWKTSNKESSMDSSWRKDCLESLRRHK